MPTLGSVIISFGSEISGFQSGIQQVSTGLRNLGNDLGPIAGLLPNIAAIGVESFGHLVGGLGSLIGTAGQAVDTFMGLGNTLDGIANTVIRDVAAWGDLAQTLFGLNAQMQLIQASFTTLTGSAQLAGATFDTVFKFAQTTPFDYKIWDAVAQRLLSMQVPAAQLTTYMQAIGDATIAVGGGVSTLSSLTSILSELNSSGYATVGIFSQLQAIGIPAFEMLGRALGTTAMGAQTLLQEGMVRSQVAISAILGGIQTEYGGTLKSLTGSWVDMTNQLYGAWQRVWVAFVTPSFRVAGAELQRLINLMTSPAIMAFASTLGTEVGGALVALFHWIGQVIIQFAAWWKQMNDTHTTLGKLWAIVKDVWTTLEGFGSALLYVAKEVFPTVINDLGPLGQAFSDLGTAIGGLFGPIDQNNKAVGEQNGLFNMTAAIVKAVDFVMKLLTFSIELLAIGVQTLGRYWNVYFWPEIQPAIPGFQKLAGAIGNVWTEMTHANNIFHQAPIQTLISSVSQLIVALVRLVGVLATYLAPIINDVVAPAFSYLILIISGVIQAVAQLVNWIASLLNQMAGLSSMPALNWANFVPFKSGQTGMRNFAGGFAMVGELGPELVHLPTGSSVYPSGQYPTNFGGFGGGAPTVINLIVDGTQLANAIGNGVVQNIRLQTGIPI